MDPAGAADEVFSAGSEATMVRLFAIRAMQELGIDISRVTTSFREFCTAKIEQRRPLDWPDPILYRPFGLATDLSTSYGGRLSHRQWERS